MDKKLVVVESPAKAKTIGQYLGSDYVVRASYGHVRDLPKTKLGIDVEHNFAPEYKTIPKSRTVLAELKGELTKSSELLLATDFDREGEAIAWHLVEELKPKKPIKRITFHEITKPAIESALAHPRRISRQLVDSQQARRLLDRLVGYKLSPFLWQKVYRGLSAGRVQSVAVRLIVEREREISAHKTREYWTVEAVLKTAEGELTAYLAAPKSAAKAEFAKQVEAQKIAAKLARSALKVESLETVNSLLKPQPPLITSTMQQAAARLYRFSAKKTMKIAQDLYEGVELAGEGTVALITYMRTDSYQMSELAKKQAENLIAKKYGAKYLPATPNIFGRKVKGAQEAHEAIRPTDFSRTPDELPNKISRDHLNLYKLVWAQATASLMSPAKVETTTAVINGSDSARLIARGRRLIFDGLLKLNPDSEEQFNSLPKLTKDQAVKVKTVTPQQHFTEPPARYSEATLVKELEKRGIGRPSTYAPIMSTIVERGYVTKQTGRFLPQSVAEVVTDLLVENFPDIVDYDFTADLEESLDDIAEGKKQFVPVLQDFYRPFARRLQEKEKTVTKREVTEEATDQKCPKCGKPVVIKLGRYGKFFSCTGFPECKYTAPYLEDKFTPREEKEIAEEVKEKCPKCGGDLAVKQSRFGTFLGCGNYPKCKFTKNIVLGIGVSCPTCGKEIVKKSSRKGKVFWGCSGYPKCKTAFWDEPTSEKCPKCGNLIVKKRTGLTCSACGYQKAGVQSHQETQ